MKRTLLLLGLLCLTVTAFAGFKAKNIRPKKPTQYQAQATIAGVTLAADLLLEGKDQKDFFYMELTPANIIVVRLAIFNNGSGEVVLPINGIQLLAPGGKDIATVTPQIAAQAVLQDLVVNAEARKQEAPVTVSPTVRAGDPRIDRTDPRYDPRMDPTDPTYDPSDPRNRRYDDRRYPGPLMRPGVDVVLNPGGGRGGGGGDLSQFEKQLVEKDFNDKAHSADPVDKSMVRDRFIYFSIADRPISSKGFTLSIPKSKGIPEEVILKF